MSVPNHIIEFIIQPIREADERNGADFLRRFLDGPQSEWERIDQMIRDIPNLWSVDDCPDEYLQYLKNIVGWTIELSSITDALSNNELRRLISVSGQLWKGRGSEVTLTDVLYFATGARCRYYNWFDFRWLIPTVGPPDAVAWFGAAQFVFQIDTLAGTVKRDGMLWEVTALETGSSAQGQMSGDVVSGFYLFVYDQLGYPGAPSSIPDNYSIRQAFPVGTELGEEHEGRDPWIIDLPDPAVAGSDYVSNLRVVDDSTLNRTLVDDLVELMRSMGESWEVTYLGLLDRFTTDGDNTQWEPPPGYALNVSGGTLSFGQTGVYMSTYCIAPNAVWDQAAYSTRLRAEAAATVSMMFHFLDVDNTYYVEVTFEEGSSGTSLILGCISSGTPTTLGTADMSAFPLYANVYYTHRMVVTDEGSSKRIQVYVDGSEVLDVLHGSPLNYGTIGFLVSDGVVEIDEVEVVLLPADAVPVPSVPWPSLTFSYVVAGNIGVLAGGVSVTAGLP